METNGKDVLRSREFDSWLRKLRDPVGKSAILFRLQRIQHSGHFGDVKFVGQGVFELRISTGRGYRIYYIELRRQQVYLLVGGSKASQRRDIRWAFDLAKQALNEFP
jgi:putative addiction module killer protein